jgi:hypothetical protein
MRLPLQRQPCLTRSVLIAAAISSKLYSLILENGVRADQSHHDDLSYCVTFS